MNSQDKFLEKDMEDLIVLNPQKYLGESGLKLIKRQHSTKNYRFDLLFKDRHGAVLIVEIQRGTLDRNHTYKILDYYDEYKINNPVEFIELMVVANRITTERRERLSAYGITFKEIPESIFRDDPNFKKNEIKDSDKNTKIRSNSTKKTNEQNDFLTKSPDTIDSKYVKKTTNTLFRQNKLAIDGNVIFYSLKNLWVDNEGTKKGISIYSSSSKHLLVIPEKIVQQYLFTPIFKKSSTGYSFRKRYEKLEGDSGRIYLYFRIEENKFAVYIKPLKRYNISPIKVMLLSKKYWPQMNSTEELEQDIITTIIELSRIEQDHDNIIILQDLNQ